MGREGEEFIEMKLLAFFTFAFTATGMVVQFDKPTKSPVITEEMPKSQESLKPLTAVLEEVSDKIESEEQKSENKEESPLCDETKCSSENIENNPFDKVFDFTSDDGSYSFHSESHFRQETSEMTSTGNGMPSQKTFSQSIEEKKRTDEPDELEISQLMKETVDTASYFLQKIMGIVQKK